MALPAQNQGQSTNDDLGVTLDTEGRTKVEVFITNNAESTYNVWGANDNVAWRLLFSFDVTTKGHRGFNNGYRYVNIGSYDLNSHFIELTASGAP